MGAQSTYLSFETLRSIDSASFTGSYQALGAPLANQARLIKLINNSDQLVTVSTDGSTNHDIIPAGSFVLYDAGANKNENAPYMCLRKGIQFSVKGSAGTGLVYLVSIFADTPTQTLPL